MRLVVYVAVGRVGVADILEMNRHLHPIGNMLFAILPFSLTVFEGMRAGAPVALVSAGLSAGTTLYNNLSASDPQVTDPMDLAGLVAMQVALIGCAWVIAGFAWRLHQSSLDDLREHRGAIPQGMNPLGLITACPRTR